MNKKVLVLPGDGIGREVCDATLPVFDRLNSPIDLSFGDIGWECWMREGDPVPQDTWDKIAESDAILLLTRQQNTAKVTRHSECSRSGNTT